MGTAFRSVGSGETKAKSVLGIVNEPPNDTFNDNIYSRQTVIRPWAELLKTTIVTEILPLLVSAQRQSELPVVQAAPGVLPSPADVAAFVDLIVNDDIEQARAVADRVIVQYGGRDALLHGLLTPAAKLFGEMWEQDVCDFMTVTLGVYRLDQIMKETATAGFTQAALSGHDHRILLLPVPGEQHGFGLGMVADVFREGGWCVRSGPAASRAQLLRIVKDEWFDVVGLSVTADRALKGLPGTIRALRKASCNPKLYVMVGGNAIADHDERTRFLGADYTANNAHNALEDANIFMDATVTAGLHQPKTRQVDIG